MASPVSVLGFSGSLRKGSFNAAVLRAAVELTPVDMRLETFDLHGIPLYDGDVAAARPALPRQAGRHRRRVDGRLRHRTGAVSPATDVCLPRDDPAQQARGLRVGGPPEGGRGRPAHRRAVAGCDPCVAGRPGRLDPASRPRLGRLGGGGGPSTTFSRRRSRIIWGSAAWPQRRTDRQTHSEMSPWRTPSVTASVRLPAPSLARIEAT